MSSKIFIFFFFFLISGDFNRAKKQLLKRNKYIIVIGSVLAVYTVYLISYSAIKFLFLSRLKRSHLKFLFSTTFEIISNLNGYYSCKLSKLLNKSKWEKNFSTDIIFYNKSKSSHHFELLSYYCWLKIPMYSLISFKFTFGYLTHGYVLRTMGFSNANVFEYTLATILLLSDARISKCFQNVFIIFFVFILSNLNINFAENFIK